MQYLLVFCLLLNMASFAWAQNHAKVSKQLMALDSESTVDVIVQYRVHPDEAHFRRARNLGASEKTHFRKLSAATYKIPASAIASLANDPDVTFVSMDHKLRSHLDISAKTINAPAVWASNYIGAGVGIAVIDSGIDSTLQDLGSSAGQIDPDHSRIVFKENFLVPATTPDGHVNSQRYQTSDGYGHGTHVAGIIAGNGFLSTGPGFTTTYQGIAPGAKIIDFQVLDSTGRLRQYGDCGYRRSH